MSEVDGGQPEQTRMRYREGYTAGYIQGLNSLFDILRKHGAWHYDPAYHHCYDLYDALVGWIAGDCSWEEPPPALPPYQPDPTN